MKKILLLAVLVLMGCESPQESVARFKYTKDFRTNQCFALYSMGTQSSSMTYVPCSEEVEKAIKQDSQR